LNVSIWSLCIICDLLCGLVIFLEKYHEKIFLVALTAFLGVLPVAKAENMSVISFDSLTFSKKEPGWPQIAPVKGDPTKGPSSIVMKMGKGAFPVHTHTSNYQLVVIKGQMKHWGVDSSRQQAKLMGPGSFWYQPANQQHADSCESKECTWFITHDGVRDYHEQAK
jgi:hypothetical protein